MKPASKIDHPLPCTADVAVRGEPGCCAWKRLARFADASADTGLHYMANAVDTGEAEAGETVAGRSVAASVSDCEANLISVTEMERAEVMSLKLK